MLPVRGGFSHFPALVAQRQRHGVQDAASVSSNLTECTLRRQEYQDTGTRSCRNWKTDRLEEPGAEGSNPSERTHGPEPYPDGREDVCKTSGMRFDSAPGLDAVVCQPLKRVHVN